MVAPSWKLSQITRVQTLLITVLEDKVTGMTALGNHSSGIGGLVGEAFPKRKSWSFKKGK